MSADTAQCTGYALKIMIMVVLFLLTIPTLAVAIASFVIAGKNWHSTCDTGFVTLHSWLVGNGVASLFYTVGGVVVAFMLSGDKSEIYLFYIGITTALIVPFKIIWNVIGAVVLFGNSTSCQTKEPSLWKMTLATLILQWIIFHFGFVLLVWSFLKPRPRSSQVTQI